MAVPNLVVGRLGAGGALSLFNNTGTVHLVGDLVGYFTPSSNVGLMPLTPARLLDTRDGTGAAAPGPIGQRPDDRPPGRRARRSAGERRRRRAERHGRPSRPTGSFLTV